MESLTELFVPRVVRDQEAHVMVETEPGVLVGYLNEPGFCGVGFRTLEREDEVKPLADKDGEPYTTLRAARNFLNPSLGGVNPFHPDALDALMPFLPSGDFHLFTPEGGFIGRFAEHKDALDVARALRAKDAVVIGSPDDVKALSMDALLCVLLHVGIASDKIKQSKRFYQEVFTMAKGATKTTKVATAATKAAKVKGDGRGKSRPDGPVAQVWAICDGFKAKGKETDTTAMRAACVAKGINPGTVSVQMGKWRKENKIVVARAKPAKRATKKATETKAAKPEKDASTPLPATPPKGGGKVVKAKKKAAKKSKSASSTSKPDTPTADAGSDAHTDPILESAPPDASISEGDVSTINDAAAEAAEADRTE